MAGHESRRTLFGDEARLKKKLALEAFMSGVVVFDALGYAWQHLPVWPFLPMWVGAILEVEVGARVLVWLRVHIPKLHRSNKDPPLLQRR